MPGEVTASACPAPPWPQDPESRCVGDVLVYSPVGRARCCRHTVRGPSGSPRHLPCAEFLQVLSVKDSFPRRTVTLVG